MPDHGNSGALIVGGGPPPVGPGVGHPNAVGAHILATDNVGGGSHSHGQNSKMKGHHGGNINGKTPKKFSRIFGKKSKKKWLFLF